MTSILENVLAMPYPSLDENTHKEQHGAYSEALARLVSSKTTFTSIPAGAGSGKTRTLRSIIVGLLRLGVEAESIENISFTNASADDFQSKLIGDLVRYSSQGDSNLEIQNLAFSTIHKHAIDLLKKLEPHIGGVGYYFEDAGNNNESSPSNENVEEEARRKAFQLALFSSIEYGGGYVDLDSSLSPYFVTESYKERFPIAMELNDHKQMAHDFIRRDMMSDAGLGAFTNIDDNNPDFCIAVATDSLMRLQDSAQNINIEERRQRFGLPAYMLVDEGQDIDLIQFLYLRALQLNGVSVVIVGDPRQTLYEFRQAVSEWPFEQQFINAFYQGTDIDAKVADSALKANYRSRADIVNFAEDLSEAMVAYSTNAKIEKKINRINDPSESVIRSHYNKNDELKSEKEAPAVRFYQGGKTDDYRFILPSHTQQKPARKGALGRLERRSAAVDKVARPAVDITAIKRKITHIQIPNLCGGDYQKDIENAIISLYERARHNEKVAILTRNGVKPADIHFIKQVLSNKYKEVSNPSRLRINLISPEKNAPLSSYWFLGQDNTSYQEVPFTSILIGAALNFFFSWDKDVSDLIRMKGLKEISVVTPAATLDEVIRKNAGYKPKESISLEMQPYFEALLLSHSEFFPGTSKDVVEHNIKDLIEVATRFVYDVLMKYAVTLWENFGGVVFTAQPCRFMSSATEYKKEIGQPILRPLNNTKRYFKCFWQALVNTPFRLSPRERDVISRSGATPEWSEITTNLLNYPEELVVWRDEVKRLGTPLDSEITSRIEDFINQREVIHEQFSKLFHLKTRTYLRDVASEIGHLIRRDPETKPERTLMAAYNSKFRAARQKARTSTWRRESGKGGKSISYAGLFEDFKQGIRSINVQNSQGSNKKDDKGKSPPTIDLTTVHSSKGLEWDHVVLFFPQASANDRDTSFKSARDLLYVATTRAARTLTVVIGSDKNYKELVSNTCMKVSNRVVNQLVRQQGLFEANVEFESKLPEYKDDVADEPIVELQTSHSELEKAMTCRLHHYNQHYRSLSTMVPITAPSYSFFFHSAMSSVCAGIIGQRLEIPDDPVMAVVKVIDNLARTEDLSEEKAYIALTQNVTDEIMEVMESMIPMYFLSGGKRFVDLLAYYTEQFTRQVASIMVGSQLFKNLMQASLIPGHKIWIEKPLKDVFPFDDDGLQVYLPVHGIPDIKISGPVVKYVGDYKTVPSPRGEEPALADDIIQQISNKTFAQINLYQGLIDKQDKVRSFAEVIYVPDITLFEGDPIPKAPPVLPKFNNNADFRVRANLTDAVILSVDQFDQQRLDDTISDINSLRYQSATFAECPQFELYKASPLVGTEEVEVTVETCFSCQSSVHCQKRKQKEFY